MFVLAFRIARLSHSEPRTPLRNILIVLELSKLELRRWAIQRAVSTWFDRRRGLLPWRW